MPTFDVIVPCYNYSKYLERCVKSALSQEGADVRVLVIDDCSSDDSALIGQKLAREDSRVEFRRHARNHGAVATFNEGLMDWAKADYSLLISADDAMAPGAFQRALRLFEASADVGFVYGKAKIITHDEDFRFPPNNDFISTQIIPGEDFVRYCCEHCFNPVPSPTAFVRTAWQHRLGGYRTDLPHTHDLEMWIRFALSGSVGIIHSVQAEYRWHGANRGMQYYSQILGDRREFLEVGRDVLAPLVSTTPDAQLWLDSLHTCLFNQAQQYANEAFDYGDVAKHQAWSAFARELSSSISRPRWLRGLKIREALGYRMWSLLRVARGILSRRIRKPRALNVIWSPSHGDVNGSWPELSSNS